MNLTQALDEARNRWGSNGVCSTHASWRAGDKGAEQVEQVCFVGVLAGNEVHIRGEGADWISAFKSAAGYERAIKVLAQRRTNEQR